MRMAQILWLRAFGEGSKTQSLAQSSTCHTVSARGQSSELTSLVFGRMSLQLYLLKWVECSVLGVEVGLLGA